MAEIRQLSAKIHSSFERNQRERAEQQKLIDEKMNELLEQRERFAAVARSIMESVIRPRMEDLSRHFDNAAITEHLAGDAVRHTDRAFLSFFLLLARRSCTGLRSG